MKHLIIILISITIFSLYGNSKVKINFFRHAKVGNVLKCRISGQTSTISRTSFVNVGQKEKVNSLKQSLTLTGELRVLSVENSGYASKIEFKVETIKGLNNNIKFNPKWSGKTLLISLIDKSKNRFRMKNEPKVDISKEEFKMLSILFRPIPKESMHDYIGTDNPVSIGDSWTANTIPFVNFFKNQGIVLPKKSIKGEVLLKSRKVFKNIDCWEIEEKLHVVDIPNFSFYFSLLLLLPVDSKIGNLKMVRKAFEKIEKKPDGKHFMTSGIKKITLEMSDSMNAEMLPVKR